MPRRPVEVLLLSFASYAVGEALHPPPQPQLGGVDADPCLLEQLARRAVRRVLAGLEVPARRPPLLRVDRRELVALLEQKPAPAVDEDHTGEEVGHRRLS